MGTEAKQEGGLNQLQVNLLLVVSLLCSLCSGLTFKGQQKIEIDGVYFNHPFMQSMTMFIGEALCYPVFMWYKRSQKDKYEASREKALSQGQTDQINKMIFAIPTLCDFITSTISFFAMSMMPLSVNYMVRGGNIITTAIFSVIFLKRKLYRQHVLGIFLAVAGLVLIGVFALVINPGSDDSGNLLLGIILTVASFITYASQMVFEEKLFSKYFLHPFQAVGYEGFWGIFITWIGINIFSFIPCPSVIPDCPKGYMESAPQFFEQVFTFKSPLLFFLVILGIFIILILNGVGLAVTKYASAIVRSLLGVTSPFLVWMMCLAIGWEKFAYGQLIGFLVITSGTLVYNEIIVLPFLGFNKNLKRDLAKRKQEEEEEIKKPLNENVEGKINFQNSNSNISYD